ncbi:MAG: nucleotidyltransferase domain-containing protein [Oligoflexia bacterium]|nr:nucleotidyltransferase domain-containing protein [Oligoflexia bacterium]
MSQSQSQSMDRTQVLNQVSSFFAKHDEIKVVAVYGSWTAGKPTPQSDVDVAIAGDRPLSTDEKLALAGDLSLHLKKEVDLVDLRILHGVILKEIIRDAAWVKKGDLELLVSILKRQLFEEADFRPLHDYVLEKKRERFLKTKL